MNTWIAATAAFTTSILPLIGALEANIATNRGNIKVTLEYTKAPWAVGNFVGLSEGTRSWIDPRNGELKKSPFYNGILFHRVVNESTFKIIQAGCPKANGSSGPGYVFPDEFTATLPVGPYVLAMANSGPNTNGSQFFFTGSVGASWLNNVHTVLGTVTDTASRGVIDSILAAGAGAPPASATTISGVSIARTDPAAQSFDPLAQTLPTANAPRFSLTNINPSSGTGSISINQPPRSLLRIYRTVDLSSWSEVGSTYLDRNASPASTINIGAVVSGVSRQFFRIPVTTYPSNAIAPDTLGGRVLTVSTSLFGPFVVEFFNNGGGTVTFSGGTHGITGYDHDPEGYSASIIVYTNELVPIRFQPAYDSENSTSYSGRASASYYNFGWQSMEGTTFTLTK